MSRATQLWVRVRLFSNRDEWVLEPVIIQGTRNINNKKTRNRCRPSLGIFISTVHMGGVHKQEINNNYK